MNLNTANLVSQVNLLTQIYLIDVVPLKNLAECDQLRSTMFIAAPQFRIISDQSIFLTFSVENDFVSVSWSDQNDDLLSFLEHPLNNVLVMTTCLPVGGIVFFVLHQIFFNSLKCIAHDFLDIFISFSVAGCLHPLKETIRVHIN